MTLHRPLLLDLGAVAKGLAIDMAARELQPFENFAIDAGGDLYFGGCNAAGEPWSVGIRHPRGDGLLDTLRVSDAAVCTSGDYERRHRCGTSHPGSAHRRAGQRCRQRHRSCSVGDGGRRARDRGVRAGPGRRHRAARASRRRRIDRDARPRAVRHAAICPELAPLILSPAMSLVSVRRFFRTPKGLGSLPSGCSRSSRRSAQGRAVSGPVLAAGNRRRDARSTRRFCDGGRASGRFPAARSSRG